MFISIPNVLNDMDVCPKTAQTEGNDDERKKTK